MNRPQIRHARFLCRHNINLTVRKHRKESERSNIPEGPQACHYLSHYMPQNPSYVQYIGGWKHKYLETFDAKRIFMNSKFILPFMEFFSK